MTEYISTADTTLDPKQQNRDRILALFFENQALSKPQIADTLGLSIPTVNAHMKDLEGQGLIGKGELMNSSGGRPAVSYSLIPDSRLAIGVEVRKTVINICLVDLRGKIVKLKNEHTPYVDEADYCVRLGRILDSFIKKCGYPKSSILGIGVTLQAAVDRPGRKIIFSGIIPTAHFNPLPLSKTLGLPVRLCHDVKADAQAELWLNRSINNGIYIALSEHLGGALIKNHRIEHGRYGFAGSFEHMTIGSKGRICYCGRKDCLETYCSMEALLEGEDLNDFFRILRSNKSPAHKRRWKNFLTTLSKGLYQTWLLLERQIILGGEMAYQLLPEDVDTIEKEILKRCSFTYQDVENDQEFVSIATVLEYAAPIGSALPFLAAEVPERCRPIEAWQELESSRNN